MFEDAFTICSNIGPCTAVGYATCFYSSAFGQASMQLCDGVEERSFPYTVFLTLPLYLLHCDVNVYLTADAVAAVLQAAGTNIQIQCIHDLFFV